MIRSTSVMKDIVEVCTSLRRKYFGEASSRKDFKDSFVINRAIEDFRGVPADLMTEAISHKDRAVVKVSKSVNFRLECYEKVGAIASTLQISEAEVCRRILYYALEENHGDKVRIGVSTLKEKAASLKCQMEKSVEALNELMLAISLLEDRENAG